MSSVSGRADYDEAITADDEGTSIRLSMPLTVRGASAEPADTPDPRAAATSSVTTARRSVGLLALLHFLWESAQLNLWHPARDGARGAPAARC